MGCVSHDSHPRKLISGKMDNWVQNTPSSSPWAHGTTSKFGKEGVSSVGVIQKCEPHEHNPCAPRFEERRGHKTTPCTMKDAPAEQHGTLQKVSRSSKTDTATFYSPQEATSKLPEEREFVVDSGASMHMLSKKDLSSSEMDTLRISRIPTTVVTANGEVQTNEEAQVYVHDLDLFVTVQLLDAYSSITWKALRRKWIFQ